MPLSKARDRDRKAKERAKSRLEKLLCSSQTSKSVQPKRPNMYLTIEQSIDADGNPIYDS